MGVIRSASIRTRPVARQYSSPDIAYFVSGKFCNLAFDMTCVCVCVCVCVVGGGGWGGGVGGGERGEGRGRGRGIALCKIFIKSKMNQISDKVRKY